MEKKKQRKRLYALLMAFFVFVTTVAGNGTSLYLNAENLPEDSVSAQEDESLDTATLVTSTDGLKKAAADGKKIVLYSPKAQQALTAKTSANGKGLAGTEVSPTDGKVMVPDDAVRMNVEVKAAEGEKPEAYSFSYPSGEKTLFLTSGPTGSTLTFEEAASDYSLWNLAEVENKEGTYFIDNANAIYHDDKNNVDKIQSLQYFNGFTMYGKGTTDIYQFQFYVVEEATVGYVIYNKEYKKALSSNSSSNANFLAGVDLEESFATVKDTEVWKINETGTDGEVNIVTYKDGRKLSMKAEKSDTLLDQVNDIWTMQEQEDGSYYIVNVARKAGGGNNHTLEWYAKNNYFSSYNPEASQQNVNDYRMTLIPVTRSQIEAAGPEEPEPEDTIVSTKNCVIYNPEHKVALSSVYSGFYNKSVPMESTFTTVVETEVWKVNTHQSGNVTISAYTGKGNLAMGDSFASTPLDEKNDKWKLIAQEDGSYYIENVVRAGYTLQYQADKGTYSGYNKIEAGKEGDFKMQLLEVQESQIEKLPEEPPREPVMEDGDYFIYSQKAEGVMRYILTGGAASQVPAVPTEDGKADFGDGDGTGAAVFHFEWQSESQTYLIKCGTEYLSLDTSNNARLLYRSEKAMNTKTNGSYWIIQRNEELNGYTIMNDTAKSSGADVYLEYYPSSGFCAYTIKDSVTDIYIFDFLDATGVANDGGHVGTKPDLVALPEVGKTYAIYNESGASIIGGQADAIDGSAATLAAAITTKKEDGTLSLGNGGLIFTLEKEGDYYLLENKGKYLATNTKEELLLLTKEECAAAELETDYKWELAATEDGLGITIKSATIRYNGNAPIFVEYFSGGFSGYSFKAGQPEIFTFQFIECNDEYGLGYVVNPKVVFNSLAEANQDVDFDATFTLDDMGTPSELKAEVTFEDNTKKTYTPSMDEPKEQGEVVKTGKVTVPKADLVGHTEMTVVISVTSDLEGNEISYSGTRKVAIHDEPLILSVSPAPNSSTGTQKRPTISVVYANIGDNAEAKLAFNGKEGLAMVHDAASKSYNYTPDTALVDNKYTAEITITRQDGKKVSRSWSFYIGEAGYKVKFGQIHSHTAEYSDGSGTLENAYEHAKNNADDMDYLIVTDHSNYFDTTGSATKDSIYDDAASSINKGTGEYPGADASKNLNLWQEAKATAAYYDKQSADFVAGFGYEMTWSGGPGHINVFNSKGIVSRNNAELNNKKDNSGMLAFYDLVVDADNKKATSTGNGNISAQFNHPGTTFGFFDSFTGLTPERDKVMTLIEVGNGDGAVGGTGYFPSYEYYDMCLSLGWHVAPTNGQDNHKGAWGSISPTRTVALTENFSEDGVYEAMNQRRVYSTEDQNLTMIYTLDDYQQGSIIENYDKDTVTLNVSLSDEDQEALGKVYVVGEGGKILNEKNPEEVSGNTADLTITLDNTSPYYYIKVVQADGDIAVSAPIWVADVSANKVKVKAAVTDVVNEDGSSPVENKETSIKSTLTNGESQSVNLISYSVAVDGETVKDETLNEALAAGAEKEIACPWTPAKYGAHKITINYVVKVNGEQHNITASKNIHVQGTNYNTVSAISETKTAQEGEEFTVEGIITANTSGFDQNTAFFDCTYVQDATGGINIFPLSGNYKIGQKVRVHGGITYYCGEIELNLSEDYGGFVEILDENPNPVDPTKVSSKDAMADSNVGLLMEVSGTVSRVHEASGVIDRIYVQDAAGDEACVYINGYIWNSKTQNYDFGSDGTTVKEGDKVTAVGIGSIDVDELGEAEFLHRLRVRDRAEINVLPSSEEVKVEAAVTDVVNEDGSSPVENKETLIKSTITNKGEQSVNLISYSVSVDGETVKDETVNESLAAGAEKEIACPWTPAKPGDHKVAINYVVEANGEQHNVAADKDIYVQAANNDAISAISETKTAQQGEEFTIEGIITANTSGHDQNTAFLDCTYVQDATGGINIFPLSGDYKVGQKVRVHGGITSYCGEVKLNLSEDYGGFVEILDENPNPVEPAKVSNKDAMADSNVGLLMEVSGTVSRVHETSGVIDRIYVKDAAGDEACVYINGYIWNSKTQNYHFGSAGTSVKAGDKVTAVGIGSIDVDELGEVEFLHRLRVRDRAEIDVLPSSVEVTDVKLNKSTLSVYVGKTSQLSATILPSDATDKNVTWTTSDKSVATVTSSGLVKGVKAGKATIKATTSNGKSAACVVTVKKHTVTLKSKTATICKGKTVSIKIKSKSLSTDKVKSYKSDKTKIATVSSKGVVKGKKAGKAKITVTMKSGAKATFTVTVKNPSVTLKKKSATVKVGKTAKIQIKKKFPSSDKVKSYKSNKPKIATVSNKGVVKGKKAGKANITVTMKSGAKATFKVTVKKK